MKVPDGVGGERSFGAGDGDAGGDVIRCSSRKAKCDCFCGDALTGFLYCLCLFGVRFELCTWVEMGR